MSRTPETASQKPLDVTLPESRTLSEPSQHCMAGSSAGVLVSVVLDCDDRCRSVVRHGSQSVLQSHCIEFANESRWIAVVTSGRRSSDEPENENCINDRLLNERNQRPLHVLLREILYPGQKLPPRFMALVAPPVVWGLMVVADAPKGEARLPIHKHLARMTTSRA